jgi:DNA-binding SARP family transcriptional activator
MKESDLNFVKKLAKQLENPFFLALVKMIKLYIKFNYEEESKHIHDLVERDHELS